MCARIFVDWKKLNRYVCVCIETECNLKAAIVSVVGWDKADCMFIVLNLFVFLRFPGIYMWVESGLKVCFDTECKLKLK